MADAQIRDKPACKSKYIRVSDYPKAVLAFFDKSMGMLEEYAPSQVKWARTVRIAMGDPAFTQDYFWYEYVWCVCVSGFRASVIDALWNRITEVVGDWRKLDRRKWTRFKKVFASEPKFGAMVKTAKELRKQDWDCFRKLYLSSVDSMEKLPWIGPVVKYHLARNLGFECVKPDVHLVRLAEWYGFDSPLEMCTHIAAMRGERLGLVDLVLWHGCSTWGTSQIAKELKDAEQRNL